MLKIKDSTGKVIGTLKDDSVAPEMEAAKASIKIIPPTGEEEDEKDDKDEQEETKEGE